MAPMASWSRQSRSASIVYNGKRCNPESSPQEQAGLAVHDNGDKQGKSGSKALMREGKLLLCNLR